MGFVYNALSNKLEQVGQLGRFEEYFQGAWNSGTGYTRGQSVAHSGTVWVCLADHSNQEPPNTTYWSEYHHERDATEYLQQYVAATALGGQRAVVVEASGTVAYADRTTPGHASKVLGITIGAAGIGETVTIQTRGEMNEPSWNWTLDQPVFVSTLGQLTQTPPASGFLKVIGFPITATRLFIQPQPSITLT